MAPDLAADGVAGRGHAARDIDRDHPVDVGGELQLDGTSSGVVVDRAAKVTLKVDRGDVSVQRATEAVAASVSGADVHILDASAKLLGRIRFPAHVSNFCWGDDDWKSLFITDHHRVYRTRVKVAGVPVW